MNRKQHRNEHWQTYYNALAPYFTIDMSEARTFLTYYNSAFPVPEAKSDGELVDKLERATALVFKIEPELFKTAKRHRYISEPRQVLFHLLRKYTALSFSLIANRYNKDHATVLYGDRHIQDLLRFDGYLRTKIDAIERMIVERK